ncbi:MAG: Hpt domain-containing protein [Rubrivivax sp.]|nr:MAG: Hpt domain-containing protein [Rubrivivax sp.]
MTDLTTLPLLDPSPMAELWQASPSRAARLLGFYLEDLPGQISGILTALQTRNAAQIGDIAHSLKSSSRQMGALKLGEAAYRVEQAARSNPPDPYLPQFVQSLSGLVPATISAVTQQLNTHKQPESQPA